MSDSDGSNADRMELALHNCDNRFCVNPKHLYWGSHSDNNKDSIVRSNRKTGYAPRGECHRGHTPGGKNCTECSRIRGVVKNIRKAISQDYIYIPGRSTLELLKNNGLTMQDCYDLARKKVN